MLQLEAGSIARIVVKNSVQIAATVPIEVAAQQPPVAAIVPTATAVKNRECSVATIVQIAVIEVEVQHLQEVAAPDF